MQTDLVWQRPRLHYSNAVIPWYVILSDTTGAFQLDRICPSVVPRCGNSMCLVTGRKAH